jgi:hypothetical protein
MDTDGEEEETLMFTTAFTSSWDEVESRKEASADEMRETIGSLAVPIDVDWS